MKQFVFATAVLLGAVTNPGAQTAPKPSPKEGAAAVSQVFHGTAPRATASRSNAMKPFRFPNGIDGARPISIAPSRLPANPSRPESFRSLSNRRDVALGGNWAPTPKRAGGSLPPGTCACSGSPGEGEADCGLPTDTVNGGCNSIPEVYSSIALGGSVCGSGAYDPNLNFGTRDTDWYQFSLAATTTVHWTVRAEFPVQVDLLSNQCPPTIFTEVYGSACSDVDASATLPPGDYVAFTAYDWFHSSAQVDCGTANSYHATLSGPTPPTGCTYDDGTSEQEVGLGNFGGGEQLYLQRFGNVGDFTQVSSVSMAWGSPVFPGDGVPDGTSAKIRIFKDPNDDGIPDDLVQLATKDFTTTGVDTDVPETVPLDSAVQVSGVYFIGVSLVSGDGQFGVAFDLDTPSANRAWFVAASVGTGGVLDYSNLPGNEFFGEMSGFGFDGVFLLRADCQPLDGGCRIDDGVSDDAVAYGAEPGEKLFLHRAGAVGEVAEISAISMSWGTAAIPGFSVPNGTPATIRIFKDPNDDGIPDDLVEIASASLTVQDVDTDIFHATPFAAPVTVRGVYFYGVSIVADFFQWPMGFDESNPSANRAWFVEASPGNIDYSNLPSNTRFGEVAATFGGIDGVFMLRADCHPATEVTAFCVPGVDGVATCPCGNPQVPADSVKGCNNFAGGGTGGAVLAASGAPTITGDTMGMDVTAGLNSNVTVLFEGTADKKSVRSGAGVVCVGGTLFRLYTGNQSAGAISFPNNGVSFHDQSSAKGYPISAPVTLYYYAAYRNSAANGQPGCPGLTFGFNTTNALAIVWTP